MQLSKGELLDKLSILYIKQLLLRGNENDPKWDRITEQITACESEVSPDDATLLQLAILNFKIFLCVDVMSRPANDDYHAFTGRAIVELNNRRSAMKNFIDRDTGYVDVKL